MEALNDAAYSHLMQADDPEALVGDEGAGGEEDAGLEAPAGAGPAELEAEKAARKASRKADLEQLRGLRATLSLKALAETPLAAKHGWTSKDKLKDALRVRPRTAPDSAARAKAERATRGPLTEDMLTEIRRRLALGEALADVRKSDACGGSLRLFPLDLLRRRTSGAVQRTHQCRTSVEYKGMTMLKSGKYQVTYKKKYVGLFASAEEAAAAWNAAAAADGVPADLLNALPAAQGEGEAEQAAPMAAAGAEEEEEEEAGVADEADEVVM